MKMKSQLSLDKYLAIFDEYGDTDRSYLREHGPRFLSTQRVFYETWSLEMGSRLLDVGAHWLHQSLLYAHDGFKVTAADFPETLAVPSVKKLAEDFGISLFPYHDLSAAGTFDAFPDDSFDVILFTEILEHITYNPVDMWKGLYRILAPGGRIIVTTPNYYRLSRRLWDPRRLFGLMGGGLSVYEIINIHTYGHHWKEYSAREIQLYFESLSPDFTVGCLRYVSTPLRDGETAPVIKQLLLKMKQHVGFLRQNIHAEITLREKQHGIVIEPHW